MLDSYDPIPFRVCWKLSLASSVIAWWYWCNRDNYIHTFIIFECTSPLYCMSISKISFARTIFVGIHFTLPCIQCTHNNISYFILNDLEQLVHTQFSSDLITFSRLYSRNMSCVCITYMWRYILHIKSSAVFHKKPSIDWLISTSIWRRFTWYVKRQRPACCLWNDSYDANSTWHWHLIMCVCVWVSLHVYWNDRISSGLWNDGNSIEFQQICLNIFIELRLFT